MHNYIKKYDFMQLQTHRLITYLNYDNLLQRIEVLGMYFL